MRPDHRRLEAAARRIVSGDAAASWYGWLTRHPSETLRPGLGTLPGPPPTSLVAAWFLLERRTGLLDDEDTRWRLEEAVERSKAREYTQGRPFSRRTVNACLRKGEPKPATRPARGRM